MLRRVLHVRRRQRDLMRLLHHMLLLSILMVLRWCLLLLLHVIHFMIFRRVVILHLRIMRLLKLLLLWWRRLLVVIVYVCRLRMLVVINLRLSSHPLLMIYRLVPVVVSSLLRWRWVSGDMLVHTWKRNFRSRGHLLGMLLLLLHLYGLLMHVRLWRMSMLLRRMRLRRCLWMLILLRRLGDDVARRGVFLEQFHHQLVGHPVVPYQRLATVLGHVAAVHDRASEGRLQRQLLRQGVLEMLVAQVLVKGVARGEEQLAERAFDVQGLVRHGRRHPAELLLLLLLLRVKAGMLRVLLLHLRNPLSGPLVLPLVWHELANELSDEVLLNCLVHNAVVLDKRRDGVVLGLVGTLGKGTLVRGYPRELPSQLGLVVTLREMSVKVALGLADVVAVSALDAVRPRCSRVRVLDEVLWREGPFGLCGRARGRKRRSLGLRWRRRRGCRRMHLLWRRSLRHVQSLRLLLQNNRALQRLMMRLSWLMLRLLLLLLLLSSMELKLLLLGRLLHLLLARLSLLNLLLLLLRLDVLLLLRLLMCRNVGLL